MVSNVLLWLATVITLLAGRQVQSQEAEFWNNQANETLQNALKREATLNTNIAKNVVVFVGSGLGITTGTAARILKGQIAGTKGEQEILEWEKFSTAGLAKPYTTDHQVGDGAGTATAIFSGVKTKSGLIGLDNTAKLGDCKSSQNAMVKSVMMSADNANKATGFVTTARVTHATPAALYAHSPHRDWEHDANIPTDQAALGCSDIALQLLTNAKNTKVILGGGRSVMTPNTAADPEYTNMTGLRQDGRNLIDEWKAGKDSKTSHYVWNSAQFDAVDPATTDYLLGLFEPSHMQFSRQSDEAGEPSIGQMVEKAIKILQKDEDGFFLMVEAARIDHAHHEGRAYHALHDTVAMDDAVAKVMNLTNQKDTLVIVTGDHSHTFVICGYPASGNPILGLAKTKDYMLMKDSLPYTTLTYTTGPGGTIEGDSYTNTGMRRNLTGVDTEHPDFVQPALIPMTKGSHAGEDVPIYANGPMSHLVQGVHEQNYLAHLVRYAANLQDCPEIAPSTGSNRLMSLTLVILSTAALKILK